MIAQKNQNVVVVLPSRLGWLALVGCGQVLKQLTFGHSWQEAAIAALDPELLHSASIGKWNHDFVEQLLSYLSGTPVDFGDVAIDPGPLAQFHRRVIDCCRRIPYGQTLTYGQLAAKAGSPRAARAVGNCMAANRIPLVIPCHRVVLADGRPGPFSAPGGTEMKRRLLALESGKQACSLPDWHKAATVGRADYRSCSP